ncbi:MAG: AraC family transcriptional regulator, partial [Bacteroidota bacterium]
MSKEITRMKSISQLHTFLGLPKPKHPLITLVDTALLFMPEEKIGHKITQDLYMISMKDGGCGADYGRNTLDFEEGIMAFSAPGQVYTNTKEVKRGDIQGWGLYFHPDLIRNTHLSAQMSDYTFFNYEVYEALHLSEEEEQMMNSLIGQIQREYEQRVDNLSQRVIVSNLELILNYCLRYYERQFNTRSSQSKDAVTRFEKELQ